MMDPHATREVMEDLIRAEMWPEAAEAASDLIGWIEEGGVSPFPYSRETALAYLKGVIGRYEKLRGLGQV